MNVHNVSSVNASVGLDASDLKRGLDQARQGLAQCAQQIQALTGPLAALAGAMGSEAAAAQQAAAAERAYEQSLQSAGAQASATAARVRSASDSLKAFGDGATAAGRRLSLALTAPLLGLASQAVRVEASYETSMNQLQAATGASAAQMAVLGQKATDLGADLTLPGTSAADAGRAMLALSRAGLNVRDVFDASLPTMRLSAATHVENARAAQILAVTLNQFGLAGKDAAAVADLLTAAGNRTAGGLNSLYEGLRKAGPVMNELKVPVSDTVVALSLLNRAGIQGSEAGTGLRTVFSRLIDPAKKAAAVLKEQGINLFDASGKMKSMAQIAEILHDRLFKLTDQQRLQVEHTLGQQRGMTVLATLARAGAAGFDEMAKKVGASGEAARQATAQMRGIPGAIEAIRSGFETASQAAIGPVSKDLEHLGKQFGQLLVQFAELPEPTRRLWVEIAAGAAVLGPLLYLFGQLARALLSTRAAWLSMQVAFTEGGAIRTGLAALQGQFAAVSAAGLLSAGVLVAGFGAVALGIYAISRNLDSLKVGLGTLSRLPGNLAQGYGISRSFEKSMQQSVEAYRAGQPAGDPMAAAKKALSGAAGILGPGGARPGPPGTGAYDPALAGVIAAGGGQPKKTPEQREWEQLQERMARDSRVRALLAKGETVEVAKMAGEYTHLSLSQLRAAMASEELTNKATKAAESRKAYGKDIEKLDAQIRRLKAGHDAEAGGLDALREKYPGLTRAQLAHMFATQQYEMHLQKVHDAQKRVNDAIRESGMRFMEATAATRAGQAALSLFRDQAEKFQRTHPEATAQQFWATLAPNQQRRAKGQAFQGATGDLDAMNNALAEQIAGQRTGQRSQQLARSLYGMDLGQIPSKPVVDAINRHGTLTDAAERTQAGFEAFNAPLHQANQLIGTVDEQLARLGEQFRALSGKSTLARDVMQKFGVVLKDLPKDTQQSLRAFFELQRGMDFFQNFANGVQSVFQNMFTNLAEHGFKGFFRSVVQGFQQMLQQMAAQYLASQLANVFMNLLGGLFGNVFGGGGGYRQSYQTGGDYSGERPFWAGEAGPELVMPRGSGTVIPHAQSMALAGAGGTTINLHVHGVTDAASFRAPHNQQAIWSDLHREIDRAHRRGR